MCLRHSEHQFACTQGIGPTYTSTSSSVLLSLATKTCHYSLKHISPRQADAHSQWGNPMFLNCQFNACKPGTGTPLAYTIPTSHTPNSFALTEAFIRLLGCCGSVLWFVANLRSKSAWSISVPGALTSWASLPSYDFASAMSAALIPRLAKDFRTRKSCFWSGVGMMLPTECFEMPQRRT